MDVSGHFEMPLTSVAEARFRYGKCVPEISLSARNNAISLSNKQRISHWEHHGVPVFNEVDYDLSVDDCEDAYRINYPIDALRAPLCCFCLHRPSNYALEPCGHGNFCFTCAPHFYWNAKSRHGQYKSGDKDGQADCPLCGVDVHGAD